MELITDWGLADAAMGKPVARPAAFIIDPTGTVLWRYFPENWRVRMNGEAYLDALKTYGGLPLEEAAPR